MIKKLLNIFKPKNVVDALHVDSLTKQLIQNAIKSADKTIEDIMIDRSQVISISTHTTIDEFKALFCQYQHSRYPVIDENNTVGILIAKDIFSNQNPANDTISHLVRSTVYTTPNEKIHQTMLKLQSSRRHMAIVKNEYDHYIGVVTIENILESFVGAIEDEHDRSAAKNIVQINKNQYICDGSTRIDDLNQVLGSELSNTKFETLSGIISHHLGHIPSKGDKITLGSFRFKVLASDSKVIQKLTITKLQTK
ncbi:CBS domain-containing protein [Gammaproteobacteria bacterium]|nr:CBS domain-containing protein [Gammaproteobacteria bacterium]